MKLVFDIETDGLDANVIWCISIYDVEAQKQYNFSPKNLNQAYSMLSKAEKLIGHNILNYDIPVVKKIACVDLSDKKVIDTLVLSRLFNPTREGNHGLESWGYRLKVPKIEFEEYDRYSEEMMNYCERDVYLNYRVFNALKQEAKGFSAKSIQLEHDVALIVDKQRENGFLLDEKHASLLVAELQEKLEAVEKQVKKVFKPKVQDVKLFGVRLNSGKLAKKAEVIDGSKRVLLSSEEYQELVASDKNYIVRRIETPFNLGSRKQIGEYLEDFGWKPKKFTPTGQPIVDEAVLSTVKNIPEAGLIAEYLMLQKRVSQINSWFKELGEDGRVHGYVNPNGTITGRMTHRGPNMAQVPSINAPYGKECRACWTVPSGYKLVGIDASGLELRMLAHYMNDEGFTNEILNGDIHSANQSAAGLQSRNQAKTFIYALLYGAGDAKLGTVVGGSRKDGKRLRESFLDNLPAFKYLVDRVSRAATKGYLRGLDGRKVFVRSAHAALNSLLQSAGAIVMKEALVILDKNITTFDAKFVANIHDEWQIEVIENQAEEVGRLGVEAIKQAGISLELKCPLDGEYKIGDNWSDTH